MNNTSTFSRSNYTGLLRLFCSIVFLSASLFVVVAQSSGLSGIQWLKNTHLITIENLTNVQHVDYNTFVGGNLIQMNNSGNQMTAALFPNYSIRSLEVTGQVYGGNDISILYSGAFSNSNNIIKLNGNQYTVNGRRFNVNSANQGATLVIDNTLSSKAIQIKSDLESASLALSQLAANNTLSFSNQGNQAEFNVNTIDANGKAVFNITDTQLFENASVSQIVVNNNANAATILINVSGTSINWNSGNKVGNWLVSSDGRSRTLWNFYEATSITMSRQFMGALLAPKATVQTSDNINGSAAVKILNSTASVLKPYFIGDFSAPATAKLTGKVWLQGPYNAATHVMDLGLNPNGASGLLPSTDPYGLGVTASINPNIVDGIVDWVKIEVRSANAPATILKSIAAFVKSNGTLVDVNNNTTIDLELATGNYYIAIRHRNHLGIMTQYALTFSSSANVDFTVTNPSHGVLGTTDGRVEVETGVWAMWAGEAFEDNIIDNLDVSLVTTDFDQGLFDDYLITDVNLDGVVDNLDLSLTIANFNLGAFVDIFESNQNLLPSSSSYQEDSNIMKMSVGTNKVQPYILQVYPNPASGDQVTMNITGIKDQEQVQITVLNAIGKIIYREATTLYKGMNQVTLPIINLSNGFYFIRLEGNNQMTAPIKLIKNNLK